MRIDRLNRLLYGRAPTGEEMTLAKEYLGKDPQPAPLWERYVQALDAGQRVRLCRLTLRPWRSCPDESSSPLPGACLPHPPRAARALRHGVRHGRPGGRAGRATAPGQPAQAGAIDLNPLAPRPPHFPGRPGRSSTCS